jgi:hypothetical protein
MQNSVMDYALNVQRNYTLIIELQKNYPSYNINFSFFKFLVFKLFLKVE